MKVHELITKLSTLDPNTRVYVRGYEGGVDDVCDIKKIKVQRNANKGTWYYGAHDYVNDEKGANGYQLKGSNAK